MLHCSCANWQDMMQSTQKWKVAGRSPERWRRSSSRSSCCIAGCSLAAHMPAAQMPLTSDALQAPLRSSMKVFHAYMPSKDTLRRNRAMLSSALIRRFGGHETDRLRHLHCQHAAHPVTTASLPSKPAHCSVHLAAMRLDSLRTRYQGWHVLRIRLGSGSALDP